MFVVFEGIDGSGKTTVSNQVVERLQAAGLKVRHLRAEGKFASRVSESIRDLGRDARNLEIAPQTEFLLYVARDVQLIEEFLRPALSEYDVVIADRFLFTAEVLAREGRRLPREFIEPVLRAAAAGIEPDLVVLVDVDPVLARARRKAHKIAVLDKRPPSRKGLSGVGLQHRIRNGYRELALQNPERWALVKNEEVLEDTVARVTELVSRAVRSGVPSALAHFRDTAPSANRALDRVGSQSEAVDKFLHWIDLRLKREPRVAAYLLGGLSGPGIDERRSALSELVPEAVLAALNGLDDEVSWSLRLRLAERFPGAVARTLSSIAGLSPRAAELRKALVAHCPTDVAASLWRLDDEPSWALREQLFGEHPHVTASSVAWLDNERAWALRERWLSQYGARIASDYDTARVAARSITSLSGERAWAIRKQAHHAAPVAALWSLGACTDADSWRLRREYLTRAPKVVMGTLKATRDALAWEMRRRVAEDCKEAIDSIQGLDDAEAWQLREEHQDRWPSTVVKSLGLLSDGERGRALVLRQLEHHGANISLLKHVSAIALGLQRGAQELDD
ncbi:MAG: dTMP kinase [Myxococcota bacterium]